MPDPVDFIDVAGLFTDEERLVRDTVRAYVRDRILPNVAQWFEEGTLPREIGRELGRLGLLGMHLEGYGCAGASAVAYGIACLELEAGDSGVRSFASVQGSLAMYAIHRWGDEAQKRTWLARMARGEVIGCFGLTEPDFGSNPAGMRTYAPQGRIRLGHRRDEDVDHERIDRRSCDRLGANRRRHSRLHRSARRGRLFGNEHRAKAIAARVGYERARTRRVPSSGRRAAAARRGLVAPLSCLNEARFGIVWGAIGAARSCYESALEYSKTRVEFDRPIGGFQLTQAKLVDMLLELNKGALLALHLGRAKDGGRLHPSQVSLAKLNNVREALAIARQARTILGANGVTLEYPVIRHMNNLESVLTYEGTSEMHALVVGKEITGLGAFT